MAEVHLIVFDVDGTLTDSVEADFRCFEQSLEDVFNFDLSDIDWHSFPNMTDAALIGDVVRSLTNRVPLPEEIHYFQLAFFDLLRQNLGRMQPLPGVREFMPNLIKHVNCRIAFATGCWKESARLKLIQANIDTDRFAHATSDDHFLRTEIITKAIQRAKAINTVEEFTSVTYVGDGLWDLRSASTLGINFIGVDLQGSGTLIKAGVKKVIRDFENISTVEDFLL